MLFDKDGDENIGEICKQGFKVNESYAKNYQDWRRKEELQKAKDKFGSDVDDDESSTDEEEDEHGVKWTDEMDKQWLRTLSALKSKDEKIYNKDYKYFSSDVNLSERLLKDTSSSKEKPLFIYDYDKHIAAKTGGIFKDDDDEPGKIVPGSYADEQSKLKDTFKNINVPTDESELLSERQKTNEELKQEEADYIEWLKGSKKTVADTELAAELKPLKKEWTGKKAPLDERTSFLRDYVLNKRYKDANDVVTSGSHVPHYAEIVNEEMDTDEEFLDEQDDFEREYNFRHEETGGVEIRGHSRLTSDEALLRRDVKREKKAEKRKTLKERKRMEKEEEIKQVKELKKSELKDKLAKMAAIGGLDEKSDAAAVDPEVAALLLSGDFDPEKHHRLMEQLYNDEYYDGKEMNLHPKPDEHIDDTEAGDNSRPPSVASNDEYFNDLRTDNWDDFDRENDEGQASTSRQRTVDNEDEMEECMDAGQRKKWRRQKSRIAKAIAKKRPSYDPSVHRSVSEYFDEFFDIPCEDVIGGDVVCRFKYRQCDEAMDCGLTPEEILMADEKELNRWYSLKKLCQYRDRNAELKDNEHLRRRAMRKKYDIIPSLLKPLEPKTEASQPENQVLNVVKEETTENNVEVKEEPKDSNSINQPEQGKKKKKKTKEVEHSKNDDDAIKSEAVEQVHIESNEKSRKDEMKQKPKGKKDKRGANKPLDRKRKLVDQNMTQDRLEAFGIDPKKFKYTKHRFIEQSAGPAASKDVQSEQNNGNNKKHKKKKSAKKLSEATE